MAEYVTVTGGVTPEQGTLTAFEVGGQRVALASVEGTLYAFDDLCPHRQCSLAEGRLEDTVVTCPLPRKSVRRHDGREASGTGGPGRPGVRRPRRGRRPSGRDLKS